MNKVVLWGITLSIWIFGVPILAASPTFGGREAALMTCLIASVINARPNG